MEAEFATEDMKDVFSKILKLMDEEDISYVPETSASQTPKARITETKKKENKVKEEKKIENSEKNTKKVSAEEFQNTTLARMQAREQALSEKLKRNAKMVEEKIEGNIKKKPEINLNSKKVQVKPISERYESIIEERNKKISDMTEKINSERKKEMEKELTFKPNINSSIEKSSDFSDTLVRMKEWEEKKNIKALMKKDEIEEKMKEKHTFKPSLCENSVKLIGELGNKDYSSRLTETKKSLPQQETYTFTPSLSEKTKKITKNRSEAKVFSRLSNM